MEFPKRGESAIKNGRNQVVRIPRGFELPGKDAVMRKVGEKLVLKVVTPISLLAVLAKLTPLDDGCPEIPDLSLRRVEL
ncbi:MAG: hypothetical protein QM757_38145 [Paludibaculum sp.]